VNQTILRIASALALTGGAFAQTTFSNAFLRGPYTIEERSFSRTNFSETALGLLQADGAGKITGSGWVRVNGRTTVPTSVAGTYVVNGDGTGLLQLVHTATGGDAGSGPFVQNFRLAMGRLDVHLARIDNGVFTTATMRAQAPVGSPGFTVSTLRGDYALAEQGQFGFGQTFDWLGKLTLDDRGRVSGILAYQGFGLQNQLLVITGTWAVNTDGTGLLTLTHTEAGLAVNSRYFFVASPGDRFQIVRVDNGTQSTVEIERQ
jgi:hypothetical protein